MKKMLALAVGLVLLSGCTWQKAAPADTSSMDKNGSPTAQPAAAQPAEAGVVTMTAKDFTFEPREVRVKQGQPLTVKVSNAEGFHSFKIDALNVDSGNLGAGQTVSVTIPTDKTGSFEYYCGMSNHRARGMRGTLIIE